MCLVFFLIFKVITWLIAYSSPLQMPQAKTRAGLPKGKPQFHLKTFNVSLENKAQPLAYKFTRGHPDSQPCPEKCCDYNRCSLRTDTEDTIRLPCYHMYYGLCLRLCNVQCSQCSQSFQEYLGILSKAFNTYEWNKLIKWNRNIRWK